MPLTPEEKREREREKKRRQRANSEAAGQVAPVTEIRAPRTPRGGTRGGTAEGTPSVPPVLAEEEPAGPGANEASALEAVESLTIPAGMGYLAALAITLARDLDGAPNVPQRASLAARYVEVMGKLAEASKTKEVSKLDSLRTQFWTGGSQGGSASNGRKKA